MTDKQKKEDAFPVQKTEEQWRQQLTPIQFLVTRQAGTERPFTGEYTDLEDKGTYLCVCCDAELFTDQTKFHSGCGWPSFFKPSQNVNVSERVDLSHGMYRTEILCTQCGAHLGHVFADGPPPTGLRYCVNSASLKFVPSST